MFQNPSSSLYAMQATLAAIYKVRELLDTQAGLLDPVVYSQIEEYLSSMKQGLEEEIKVCETEQSADAPNLYADDASVNPWWKPLVAKLRNW